MRRRVLLATHSHLDIEISPAVAFGPRCDIWAPGAATLRIGPGCDFRRDFYLELHPGAKVEMADHVTFTAAAQIQISTTLAIGSRATFGQATLIADGNHRFRDHTTPVLDQGYDYRPITIGDNALILSKCTILNSIGEGSVIGANSVVTRPIPPFCLAVGAPARVVEYFGPEDQRPEGLPENV